MVARQQMAAGQDELDLGLDPGVSAAGGALAITSPCIGHLGDAMFRLLVLARIIEPTSKLDSLRVLQEAGIASPSYATLKWHLSVIATEGVAPGSGGVCGPGRAGGRPGPSRPSRLSVLVPAATAWQLAQKNQATTIH